FAEPCGQAVADPFLVGENAPRARLRLEGWSDRLRPPPGGGVEPALHWKLDRSRRSNALGQAPRLDPVALPLERVGREEHATGRPAALPRRPVDGDPGRP